MKPSVIPPELKGKALYKFLVDNEALIVHAKKSSIKLSNPTTVTTLLYINEKGELTSKAAGSGGITPISESATRLKLNVVINTTNYFDSHYDVHIPGIWTKSLADNKGAGFYLLKQHRQEFEAVIGEGLKGAAKKMSWKDLGFDYLGITEALMFSGEIEKDRNPYMFEQYAKGRVKQHSVGMRYVRMVTCIDDEDYPVQKENWDKYFPMVINQKDAEDAGFFWAVLEAKVNEGSAVLFGSNDLTPTYEVEEAKNTSSTSEEPLEDTSEKPQTFDFMAAIKQTKFI
jgi:hypothetical protein